MYCRKNKKYLSTRPLDIYEALIDALEDRINYFRDIEQKKIKRFIEIIRKQPKVQLHSSLTSYSMGQYELSPNSNYYSMHIPFDLSNRKFYIEDIKQIISSTNEYLEIMAMELDKIDFIKESRSKSQTIINIIMPEILEKLTPLKPQIMKLIKNGWDFDGDNPKKIIEGKAYAIIIKNDRGGLAYWTADDDEAINISEARLFETVKEAKDTADYHCLEESLIVEMEVNVKRVVFSKNLDPEKITSQIDNVKIDKATYPSKNKKISKPLKL